MRRDYQDWLRRQGYGANTIVAQIHRIGRVEAHYGDLDQHYDQDRLQQLIAQLAYSTEDERRDRRNPTRIPITGNIRSNLASYKSAVLWYARFRQGGVKANLPVRKNLEAPSPPATPLSMERASAIKRILPEPRLGPRTMVDFKLDGRAALDALIAGSQYRTVSQAVASLALFSHPETVRQTGGKALFPCIRNPRRVGQFEPHEGREVLLDDNKSSTDAFLWANGLSRRGPDTQFNHVYAASLDADAYTALPNICMTPAFIAKLTDTNERVRQLLRYRSYQLYGWVPAGHDPPERPDEYETLEWAAPLPPIEDVRATVLNAMATKPKDRTVVAARRLGWLYEEASAPVDGDL